MTDSFTFCCKRELTCTFFYASGTRQRGPHLSIWAALSLVPAGHVTLGRLADCLVISAAGLICEVYIRTIHIY